MKKRPGSVPETGNERMGDSLRLLLYPGLAQLPRQRWDEAIDQARSTDFNVEELIGILAGVGFVAWFLRVDASTATDISLAGIYFLGYLAAVPLLALTVGPVMLHRTRRGLRAAVERLRQGEAEMQSSGPTTGGRR